MENESKAKKSSKVKVLPDSKSLYLKPTLKVKQNMFMPVVETEEHGVDQANHQPANNLYFMKKNSKSLYEYVVTEPNVRDIQMNILNINKEVVHASKCLRFLIIFKVHCSVIFFMLSRVFLIILIPEILGYLGIRKLKRRLSLLYVIWLFVEFFIRIVTAVLITVNGKSIDAILIAFLTISLALQITSIFQIILAMKYYNMILNIDEESKESIYREISASCIPP